MEQRRTILVEAALPDVAIGVRAALATVVPFYFAAQGNHQLIWTALGGWLGTLVDPGGSRGTRLRYIAAFAVLGAASLAGAEYAAAHSAMATLVLAAAAFFGCMLRPLRAASLGTMLTIVVAVGAAHRGPAPWQDGLYFLLGAAWATVLSTVLWPVWTHLSVRRAIGRVYSELAGYVSALEAESEGPATEQQWAYLARAHRRRLRDAIEAARAASTAVRARRPSESRHGANLRVLLGYAEAQFPWIITLSEDLRLLEPGEQVAVRRVLGALRERYLDVHTSLIRAGVTSALPLGGRSPESADPSTSDGGVSELLLDRLLEASARSALLASTLDTDHGAEVARAAPRGWLAAARKAVKAALRTLGDALSIGSPHLHHAARVTLAVTAASIIGHLLAFEHAHWITITTIAVLQPFPGATRTRAAERVVGTVFGCVVAAAMIRLVAAPIVMAALMFPLSVAALTTRPRSYRLYTFFLTPVFVLVAARYPGDWHIAIARAVAAVAGGIVAFVAAVLIFPSREERRRLPATLKRMFVAIEKYATVVFAELGASESGHTAKLAEARRACGIALSEAETVLDRWLAEPIGKREGHGEVVQLITYSRRLGGALTALDVVADEMAAQSPDPIHFAEDPSIVLARDYTLQCLDLASTLAGPKAGGSASPSPPRLGRELDPALRARVERVLSPAAMLAGLAELRATPEDQRERRRDGTG